jgi:hypothetical protein
MAKNKYLHSVDGWTGVALSKLIEFTFSVKPTKYDFSDFENKYIFLIEESAFQSESGFYEIQKERCENLLPVIFKTF